MRFWLMLSIVLAGAQARAAEEIVLFNGKDFTGWTYFMEQRKDFNADGKAKLSDVATVKDGVIEITPKSHGAIITEKDYTNYKLHAEWRWVKPDGGHNTGLFLKIRPPFVWDSVHNEMAAFYQAQIGPGTAGDLWVLGGYSETKLITDKARTYKPFGDLDMGRGGHIRRHLRIKDAEKPMGEWNAMEVVVDDDTMKLYLNGELVNEGTNIVKLPGRVGLEIESGPVQFRNIRLTPIEK